MPRGIAIRGYGKADCVRLFQLYVTVTAQCDEHYNNFHRLLAMILILGFEN